MAMEQEMVLSFEEFMGKALHDPERGYYANRIRGVGRNGDFTTMPMLSRAFAKAIAHWVFEKSRAMGIRDVIEIGPGEGRLAADARGILPWLAKSRMRWHMVETSDPLRRIQQRTMGRARWYRDPAEALRSCSGRAIIYSNELVDAFPVRRFQRTGSGWSELGVRMAGGAVIGECHLDGAILPDSSVFESDLPLGQIVEVHESYRKWLGDWIGEWRDGAMLTIDYGAEVGDLYHRRPGGTVRAYLLQQRIEGMGIYQNMGSQDLTADVNFTDLIRWGQGHLHTSSLMSMARFCGSFAPQWMRDPGGAGEAFLVLEQTRGDS